MQFERAVPHPRRTQSSDEGGSTGCALRDWRPRSPARRIEVPVQALIATTPAPLPVDLPGLHQDRRCAYRTGMPDHCRSATAVPAAVAAALPTARAVPWTVVAPVEVAGTPFRQLADRHRALAESSLDWCGIRRGGRQTGEGPNSENKQHGCGRLADRDERFSHPYTPLGSSQKNRTLIVGVFHRYYNDFFRKYKSTTGVVLMLTCCRARIPVIHFGHGNTSGSCSEYQQPHWQHDGRAPKPGPTLITTPGP